MTLLNRTLSVAPMLDWTDRHYRYFMRHITHHSLLYTEMVTTGALLHGNVPAHLKHHQKEYPLALQLGGCDPHDLAKCAKMGEEWGFSEINLNCGCPSDRVQNGAFGATLMKEPKKTAQCMKAMHESCDLPVTIKHRLSVDDYHDKDMLWSFVETLANQSPTRIFIVHARKAYLQGLSPKQNRSVPPIKYHLVYQLKHDFPELTIILNGEIKSYEEINAHLKHVDGVMIGRKAYHDPYFLSQVDRRYFHDDHHILSRKEILKQMIPYMEQASKEHVPLHQITRHLLGLSHGCANSRKWRGRLSPPYDQTISPLDLFIESCDMING